MKTDNRPPGATVPDEESLELVEKIREGIIQNFNLGFDIEVLSVLDDIDSSETDIEALKGRIGAGILARLIGMAEAAYFAQSKSGSVGNFYQVVSRLGMEYTQSMILFFALPSVSKSKRIEKMLAKGFASAVIGGKVIAKDLNLRRMDSSSVEIGALLKDIGRIMIALYEEKCGSRKDFTAPTEEFENDHHSLLGGMFVDRYGLPRILKEIIAEDNFSCDASAISIPGIVHMAHAVVERSFNQNGGKLVIKSPMPDPGGTVTQSLGAVIENYFRAAGLMSYLNVIRVSTPGGILRPIR